MDNFVKSLTEEVKSRGVFDEFRFNCCLADVDTKPAYQNVRNRVETAVKDFLDKQHWTPDTNKVQLRERLRKHLLDSDVLDKGVDHIVDQVVNPKVATIFEPKIESIAYKYLGITLPPPPTTPPPRPPLLPAPPLPPYAPPGLGHINGGNLLKVETTASLLPTDLEQISPDSDRTTGKDDSKDEELPPGVDNEDADDDLDDTTSPAFEPAGSIKEDHISLSLNTSDSLKDVKELVANDSRDAGASQTSQLSQVSSDSRLTIASSDVPQSTCKNNSLQLGANIADNMSEEAQMPKFSENSSETYENSGRQLHFDIKQDTIKFEGTERKNSLSEQTNGRSHGLSIDDAIMCELKANISEVKIEPTSEPTPPPFPPLPPLPPAEPMTIKVEPPPEINLSVLSEASQNSKELKLKVPEIKQEQGDIETEEMTIAPIAVSAVSEEPKDETIKSPASTSSSSQTKKHSNSHSNSHSRDKDKEKDRRHHSDDKQRRKSRERERDRDKDKDHDKSRSKTSSSSKHSSSRSSHSSSSKHRSSSSSSKHDKSTTSTSSSRSNHESSSSASKRSSSRHDSSSSSTHKKHKSSTSSSRSRDNRDSHSNSHHSRSHNGSSKKSDRDRDREREKDRDRERNKSSSNSASNSASNSIPIIQDDHNEEKAKLQKRYSNDSNDDGKPPGGSSGKSPTETVDATTKEKSSTDSSAANGKETQTNETNGTNGTTDDTVTTNVINVSDILQQSMNSFIELSGKPAVAQINAEEMPILERRRRDLTPESTECTSGKANNVLAIAYHNEAVSVKDQVVNAIGCETVHHEVDEALVVQPNVDAVKDQENVERLEDQENIETVEGGLDKELDRDKPIEELVADNQNLTAFEEHPDIETVRENPSVEIVRDQPDLETVSDQRIVELVKDPHENESVKELAHENESIKELPMEKCSVEANVPSESEITSEASEEENATAETLTQPQEDSITHFEQNAEEFKVRLQLLEQQIKDRRMLLNVLSEADGDTSFRSRSSSKRRISSEASSSKQHSSSSCSSSSTSPNFKTNPVKRPRRDDAKTSPTPSEVSVNSKENEELEKHEKGDISARRLSQKLCQQQRYTNDDLYKPRPLLSQRSRRRGLDSIL